MIAVGFDLSLDQFKTLFFRLERDPRIAEGQRQAMRSAGAMVRTISKSLIRKPRQLSLSEMAPEQRKRHEQRLRQARRQGGPRPGRPFARARPGQPPFNRTGLLKDFIFFGFDPVARSVIVGPAALGPRTAWLLEYGGTAQLPNHAGRTVSMTFAPHPFMRPALEKARERYAQLFRNAFT